MTTKRTSKKCPRCKETYAVSEFAAPRVKKLKSYCKKCTREYAAEIRKLDKEGKKSES